MDEYVYQHFQNMLKRTQSYADDFIRDLTEEEKDAAKMMQAIYQQELENFLYFSVTGGEKE